MARSASLRRQRRICSWSPESSTSGTARPRTRRAACSAGSPGGRRRRNRPRPSPRRPGRPGSRRTVASITAQGRHLPAGEHEVAEAQLLGGHGLGHALVDPLVAAAEEHEPVEAGEARGRAPGRTAGRAARGARRRPARPGPSGHTASHGAEERLGLHDHPGPAPEGRVVHGAVAVLREVAQVVDADLHEPRLRGRGATIPSARGASTHPREDRDHVNPQRLRPAPAGSTTRRPPARSTRFTNVLGEGDRGPRPAVPRTTRTGAPPPVSRMSSTAPSAAVPRVLAPAGR